MRKMYSQLAALFLFSVCLCQSSAAGAAQPVPPQPQAPQTAPQPPAPQPAVPAPQPPAAIPQPPAQPVIPAPKLPQGVTLNGTYSGIFARMPVLMCFEGNSYAIWCNNQLMEYGTYSVNGTVFSVVTSTGQAGSNTIRFLNADKSRMQMTFTSTGETSLFQKIQ